MKNNMLKVEVFLKLKNVYKVIQLKTKENLFCFVFLQKHFHAREELVRQPISNGSRCSSLALLAATQLQVSLIRRQLVSGWWHLHFISSPDAVKIENLKGHDTNVLTTSGAIQRCKLCKLASVFPTNAKQLCPRARQLQDRV